MSEARKPRADAQRNRERLMAAAKAGFAETGPEVSLDEIARRAGVGIGTLYRHFPTRDALVEAVYRHEVEQLGAAAAQLAQSLPPAEALHQWLRLLIDYIATKKVIAQAVDAMTGGGSDLYAASTSIITEAMKALVKEAADSGGIRAEADPKDLLRAVAGFAYGAAAPGWQASALRLIDLLMDGLRAPRV
ncbi:TetR/AcrR family transcriptional regulator [soil metagenome]